MVPVVSENEDQPLAGRPIMSSLALAGDEPVSEARRAARDFLTAVQAVHGIRVADRVAGMVQLVVSELVTNARKYAPGPCLLDLELNDGAVEISVWDTEPTLPVAQATDPGPVGRHGLEVVIGVCRSFEMRREPVGKRIKAAIVLADDPGGDPASRM